jgi:hypothetical protein
MGVSLYRYASVVAAVSLIAGFCSAGFGVASAATAAPGSEATSATALTLSASAAIYGKMNRTSSSQPRCPVPMTRRPGP